MNWIWISTDTTIHNLQKNNKSEANCKPHMGDTISITNIFVPSSKPKWECDYCKYMSFNCLNSHSRSWDQQEIFQLFSLWDHCQIVERLHNITYIQASKCRYNSWWLFQKTKQQKRPEYKIPSPLLQNQVQEMMLIRPQVMKRATSCPSVTYFKNPYTKYKNSSAIFS